MRHDEWGQQNSNQQGGQGQPPHGYLPPHGYPPHGGFPPPKPPGSGMAVASMVLGIVGLIFSTVFIFAVLAIIFGVVARSQGNRGGMATAGIVMGIISLALAIMFIIMCVAFLDAAMRSPFFWDVFGDDLFWGW